MKNDKIYKFVEFTEDENLNLKKLIMVEKNSFGQVVMIILKIKEKYYVYNVIQNIYFKFVKKILTEKYQKKIYRNATCNYIKNK